MKPNISSGSTVVATTGQLSCTLSGEVVILSIQEGAYYGLDAVGARIWELIREPRRVSEVRDTLLQEYDVEPGECERDLLALLQKLADQGLIQAVD